MLCMYRRIHPQVTNLRVVHRAVPGKPLMHRQPQLLFGQPERVGRHRRGQPQRRGGHKLVD
jgi:hypothetical protein